MLYESREPEEWFTHTLLNGDTQSWVCFSFCISWFSFQYILGKLLCGTPLPTHSKLTGLRRDRLIPQSMLKSSLCLHHSTSIYLWMTASLHATWIPPALAWWQPQRVDLLAQGSLMKVVSVPWADLGFHPECKREVLGWVILARLRFVLFIYLFCIANTGIYFKFVIHYLGHFRKNVYLTYDFLLGLYVPTYGHITRTSAPTCTFSIIIANELTHNQQWTLSPAFYQ